MMNKKNRGTVHNIPTIKDVAADAHVSTSAVSKVLRDAYGVSPAMRAKVMASVERLDYRPKTAARSMRGKSYTIGVTMPEISSPFPTQIADEIDRFFKPTPYQVLIELGGMTVPEETKALDAMVDRQIDGAILISPREDIKQIEKLAEQMPMVLMARNGVGKNYDSVTDNAFDGAMTMVDYLVNLGHRDIAYTSMPDEGFEPPYTLSHTTRQSGYEHAMRLHGLTARIVVTSYTEEGGYRAGSSLLDSSLRPTAIFAGSDIAAFGVMRAADERGLRIPEDLSVVGYDNVFASGLRGVNLTTVNEADSGMGTTAARLLLDRIEGRTTPVCRIEAPTLVVRGSAAPPAVSCP